MPTVSSHELTPYASHMSIFLSDRERQTDVDYSGWHDAEVNLRRALVTPFQLQIATARYDVVPVHLRVLSGPPRLEPDAAHIAEADLQIPSGKLVLHTVIDEWDSVPDIPVMPGRYRVRITYLPYSGTPLDGADADAPGDYLDYRIDLWLSPEPTDPETVIQGPELWAG